MKTFIYFIIVVICAWIILEPQNKYVSPQLPEPQLIYIKTELPKTNPEIEKIIQDIDNNLYYLKKHYKETN